MKIKLVNKFRRYFWNKKFIETSAYCALLALVVRLFLGQLDTSVAVASLLLSSAWLVLTFLELRVLLRTYYDVLSRLLIWVPLVIGALLDVLAMHSSSLPAISQIAWVELLGWLYVYLQYRENRDLYVDRKIGPVPKGTWVNPQVEALQEGDIVLFSGRISRQVRENVGHGEIMYKRPDGELWSWSSYMECGAIRQPAADVMKKCIADGEHYIVVRLKTPWTEVQSKRAHEIVEQMYADNVAWREAETIRRRNCADRLPVSQKWRDALFEKIKPTGYDWFGLFMGTVHPNRWVCIVAAVQLDKRNGVVTDDYGTGFLGWGTGLLDPLVPIRLLGDPAYRLLTVDDQKIFEAQGLR